MEATVIYPHQLFEDHPGVTEGRRIILIEDPLFFGNDPVWPAAMHKQKLVLHRASMAAYAVELEEAGHHVNHVPCPTGGKTGSGRLLDKSLPKSVTTLHLADPSDDVLLRRVRRLAKRRGIELVVHPNPNFLSPPDFLKRYLASEKKPFMATFYEAQRTRMEILLEKDGGPEGGRWSFDTENRVKLPKKHVPPPEPRARRNDFINDAIKSVEKEFPDHPGSLAHFRWPVTRSTAEAWLDRFIEDRLENFGTYEDAISTEYSTLYHSAITPMLNIGLLDPQQVIDRVLKQAGKAPLNSLEGFTRQVIGWREFMHGIYQHHGVEIRNANFWRFDRPLPRSFYDGTTGIPPVDRVIRQLLDDGWCHHIERLMILGNFMLLCRIRPDDVYRWFMEMFVDSYDWVMVPNVYGMSQFADGGTFTTKPYISGSNYVLKMSDESKGDWGAVWDGLFWTFISDYLPFFSENHRLSMMAKTWQKLAPSKQEAHRKIAEEFLKGLD
jgi:deoxyribodipyrimidine photolyase-related protein